ncbi:ribosomal protein S18 acetylase RimI-like enzyme [Pseudomonas oryzihabitans]
MNIQRLGPAWAPFYRQLMLDAYARHPEAFTSSPEERAALPLDWWERRLQEDDQAQELVWGAIRGAELLGVVGLGRETREKVRHKATLFGLYVPDRYRRLGIAKGLLDELLTHAQGLPGLRVVQLTVTEGNDAALALYRQAGFNLFGSEPLAIAVGDGLLTKLHLWCDLDRLRRG